MNGDRWQVVHGDCLDVMRGMGAASVDAVVCDPPAGIAFMGKSWDKDHGGRDNWIAVFADIAAEALRMVKPGGHALVWALPRTSHWTATAWENGGWEVRDRVAHIFGSGFPKALNLDGEWKGWATALKPAMEDWWLLRKPLVGTVARNVKEWGTGALNVDGCRVGTEESTVRPLGHNAYQNGQLLGEQRGGRAAVQVSGGTSGRWPANVIHDGSPEVLAGFPETGAGVAVRHRGVGSNGRNGTWGHTNIGKHREGTPDMGFGDSGSAARFFYCPKASKADREEGCEGRGARFAPTMGNGIGGKEHDPETATPKTNHHPTVKPTALMRYLCRLVTPPGGTVLDPFCGSGSTGKAALLEGFGFVGIEREQEYVEIARARIGAVQAQPDLFAEVPA